VDANRLNLLREAPVVVCLWTRYKWRIPGQVSCLSLQSMQLNRRTHKGTALGPRPLTRSMALRLSHLLFQVKGRSSRELPPPLQDTVRDLGKDGWTPRRLRLYLHTPTGRLECTVQLPGWALELPRWIPTPAGGCFGP
jgi:hypothetical protein